MKKMTKIRRSQDSKIYTYLTLSMLLLVLEKPTLAGDMNGTHGNEQSEVEGSDRGPSSFSRTSADSNGSLSRRNSAPSFNHSRFEHTMTTNAPAPAVQPSRRHSLHGTDRSMHQGVSMDLRSKKSTSSGNPASHSSHRPIQNPTIESTCKGPHVRALIDKGMCQCQGQDKETQYYFNSVFEPNELKICEYLIELKKLFNSHSAYLEYHYPNRLFCKATREFVSTPLATGSFGNRGSIEDFALFYGEEVNFETATKKYTVEEQIDKVRKQIYKCEYQTQLIVEYMEQSAHTKDSEALFRDFSRKLNKDMPDSLKSDSELFDSNVALDRDPGARTVKATEILKGDHGGTRYKYVLRRGARGWNDGRDVPEVQDDLMVFPRSGDGRKFVNFIGYKWATKGNSPPEAIEVPDAVELQNSIHLWNEKYKKLKDSHPEFFKNLNETDQLAYSPIEVGFYNQPNNMSLTPRAYVKNLEKDSFKMPIAEIDFKGDQTKFTHDITAHPIGLILQAKSTLVLVSRQNQALREFEEYVNTHFEKQSKTLQFKHTFNRIFLGRSAFLDTFLSGIENLEMLKTGNSAFGGKAPAGFAPGFSAEETIQNLAHYKNLISDPSLKQNFQQAIDGFIHQELADPTFSQPLKVNSVDMSKRLKFLSAVAEDRLP